VSNIFKALGLSVILLAVVAIILGWFWGVPYLAYMIYDNISYWTYATVWLSIHLIRNIHGRIKAQNTLNKIKEVNDIMGGSK
jgi:hypothetical protein